METKLVSLLNQFVNVHKPQKIFILKFPSPKQQKSSAVQICASGDSSVLRITLEGQSLMRSAMSQLQLSARAYHRILKLSPIIADFELMKNSPIGLIIYKFHKSARRRSSLRRAAISHNGQHNLMAPCQKVHLSWGSVFELSLPLAYVLI